MPEESSAISSGIGKAMSAMPARCIVFPFSSNSIITVEISMSSRSVIQGPSGIVPSMLLPLSH